ITVEIGASDALAALARIRLADEPWPEEVTGRRVERLQRLLAARGISLGNVGRGNADMRARDVDSKPALDVVRLTTAHAPGTLASSDGRIILREYTVPAELVINTSGEVRIVDPSWYAMAQIPASAIEDGALSINAGSVLSSVNIRYPVPDSSEPSGY